MSTRADEASGDRRKEDFGGIGKAGAATDLGELAAGAGFLRSASSAMAAEAMPARSTSASVASLASQRMAVRK